MSKKIKFIIILVLFIVFGIAIKNISKTVNLAYIINTTYMPYAMVSIDSVIKNKDKGTKYHIYILGEDLKYDDVKKLQTMSQQNVKISVVSIKPTNLNKERLGRFSAFEVSLQKLFLANNLADIDKVLYLDADTLILGDLSSVFAIDLDDNYIAAVKDGLMFQFPEHLLELNLTKKDVYFNSGVMLLNLNKMRKDDILANYHRYFNTHNEIFGDQDVLNVVLKRKIKLLSYRYNFISTFFYDKTLEFLSLFYNESMPTSIKEVYKDVVIIHYAGYKPWEKEYQEPYLKSLWYEYAKKTKAKYHITF